MGHGEVLSAESGVKSYFPYPLISSSPQSPLPLIPRGGPEFPNPHYPLSPEGAPSSPIPLSPYLLISPIPITPYPQRGPRVPQSPIPNPQSPIPNNKGV
ncbi:hypothetical protein FDUTEX481_05830 [Tolypothrix sp. PCC 7601]|nr:hypothetical protein FDUTEX481_05830 [Tolypothrix sp. PCC 7601]